MSLGLASRGFLTGLLPETRELLCLRPSLPQCPYLSHGRHRLGEGLLVRNQEGAFPAVQGLPT